MLHLRRKDNIWNETRRDWKIMIYMISHTMMKSMRSCNRKQNSFKSNYWSYGNKRFSQMDFRWNSFCTARLINDCLTAVFVCSLTNRPPVAAFNGVHVTEQPSAEDASAPATRPAAITARATVFQIARHRQLSRAGGRPVLHHPSILRHRWSTAPSPADYPNPDGRGSPVFRGPFGERPWWRRTALLDRAETQ
jgi:hypothetical protein